MYILFLKIHRKGICLKMDELYDFCVETGLDTTDEEVNYRLSIQADPTKWSSYKLSKNISDTCWKTAKYLNSKGHESADFKGITGNHGGVFLWVIRPKVIPILSSSFVAYVGESEGNLNKSVHNFIGKSATYNGQLSKKQLFDRYSPYLHLVYCENDEKTFSKEVVSKLVEALQPLIVDIPISLQERGEAF